MAKTHLGGLSKSGGIQRIPYAAGKYKFTVADWKNQWRETKGEPWQDEEIKGGDFMAVVKFTIGDLYPDQPGGRKVEGKTYTQRFFIGAESESTYGVDKIKDLLNAAGVRTAADDTFNEKSAIEKEVYGDMTLGVDRRDGTMTANEVKKFYSPDAFAELGAAASSDDD